mgnify:CR=1 FL=1
MSTAVADAPMTSAIPSVRPNVEALERRVAELKQEKMLQTPPVGFGVVWYDRAQTGEGRQIAAIVTKQEQPGIVSLVVFRPNGVPEHKMGVRHISDPIHERPANEVTLRSGGWDYIDFQPATPLSQHKDFHRAIRDRKVAVAEEQVRNAQAIIEKHFDKPPFEGGGDNED